MVVAQPVADAPNRRRDSPACRATARGTQIEPPSELVADLAHAPDINEAQTSVQRQTRDVVRNDPGDHVVHLTLARFIEYGRDQSATEAASQRAGGHIDRVFDGSGATMTTSFTTSHGLTRQRDILTCAPDGDVTREERRCCRVCSRRVLRTLHSTRHVPFQPATSHTLRTDVRSGC